MKFVSPSRERFFPPSTKNREEVIRYVAQLRGREESDFKKVSSLMVSCYFGSSMLVSALVPLFGGDFSVLRSLIIFAFVSLIVFLYVSAYRLHTILNLFDDGRTIEEVPRER